MQKGFFERQIVLCFKQCDKAAAAGTAIRSRSKKHHEMKFMTFEAGRKLPKNERIFAVACHSNANQVSNKCELNHIVNTCLVP